MNSALRFRSAFVVLFAAGLAVAPPTPAAEPDLDRFKAEIDAFVGRLGPSSNGVVRWAGSDPFEIRRDGDMLVAVIDNARLSFESQPSAALKLDRVEIRRIGEKEEGRLIELALLLPTAMTLSDADGAETKITLNDATATAVVDAQSGRGRETAVKIASARLDQPKSGTWVDIGPLSMASKLVSEPNGGWSAPVEFEANEIRYFLPQAPIGGGIDRIAFDGRSAGPRLDQLDKLRDAIDRLQTDDSRSSEARRAAFLAVLPTLAAPFGTINGQFSLNGLTIRSVAGEVLLSLAKAAAGSEISGLDTEAAALRFSIRYERLDLAPSVLEPLKVPHQAVLDIGVVDLSTEALTKLLEAVALLTDERATGERDADEKKRQAIQQALGAAAMLNPTFLIYNAAVDTEDVGADLTAEAKGSPLAPKGYSAAGELVVRGFDALPTLAGGMPFAEYLPVLREIGSTEKAPDGTPRVVFHLASAPPKWITINGNDVGAWFEAAEPEPGQSRLLKPADPPMQGNDVKAVQIALAAAQIPVEQNGIYTPATAAAVARFQKQKGINTSGVVDAETRQRLGLSAEMPRQGGRK